MEDEPLIAMAEKMTLECNGYTVITSGSGENAIEAARAHREIDLILMDIDRGPGIRGTEAAEVILNERDLPLAFLSSHTEQTVVDETEELERYFASSPDMLWDRTGGSNGAPARLDQSFTRPPGILPTANAPKRRCGTTRRSSAI